MKIVAAAGNPIEVPQARVSRQVQFNNKSKYC